MSNNYVVEDDFPTQKTGQENNFEDNFARNDEEEEEDEEENYDHGDVVTEEMDFKLNEFVQRFANIKIVKSLNLLLQQFDKNTNEVNHYVTKMLHRIAYECKMSAMIFQASIFRTFQKILESKYPEHKELQKFAIFIIRRFVEVAQKNRKSYMELLFWKNAHDATQIVEGYSTETNKKKVSRGVWTEAEEDELRTLFMEHQTNKPSEDLIDWILERLINETRTRRGVIKKLKEMCLVVNSKAVRNEIQKKLPKVWSEEEIAQLTELWEQLREDEDPVELIFNGLRIKRTKPKIKEKLLELGLAKDPKELYKKRSRKSNHGKSSWETQSAGNSDDEDRDSEEESRKSSGRNDVAQNKPRNKKKTTTQGGGRSRRKKDQKTFLYTDAQLSGLLKTVIEGNMTESLEWIKESLEDALDDRDEESIEGIPLVPLTESSSDAMDSKNFQKLLRAMGMQPPTNEQEIYYRIPANMLNSTIRKRCDLIADALEGKFVVEVPSKKNINDIRNNSSDDSDDNIDVLETIKKFFTNKESLPSTSRVLDVSSDSDKSEKSTTKRDVEETAETIEIKEVEENDKNQEGMESNFQAIETVRRISKRRIKLQSDSSESEPEIERNRDMPVDEAKRSRSPSFDTETSSSKRPRLLDSDEDSESSRIKNSKSKITLESDNEEDNQEKISTHKSTASQIIDSDQESVTEKKRNLKTTRKIISDDEDD